MGLYELDVKESVRWFYEVAVLAHVARRFCDHLDQGIWSVCPPVASEDMGFFEMFNVPSRVGVVTLAIISLLYIETISIQDCYISTLNIQLRRCIYALDLNVLSNLLDSLDKTIDRTLHGTAINHDSEKLALLAR